MPSAPDFSERTKATLAKRAGQACSNPECRRPTSGPHSDESKAINLGEAAHIRLRGQSLILRVRSPVGVRGTHTLIRRSQNSPRSPSW